MIEQDSINFVKWFNKLKEQGQKWLTLEWLLQTIARICKEEIEHQLEQERMDPTLIAALLENIAIIYHHSELDQCKVKDSQNKMAQAELLKETELDNKAVDLLSEDN